MAREEKVWEYAIEAGYTPLEDRCIIVKGAAGNLSDKIVRFFSACDVAGPPIGANERTLFAFDPPLATPAKEVFPAAPPLANETVAIATHLLNVIIDIETNTGNVRLTTQQKELSDIRLSGIYASQYAGGYKNWHAENEEATLKAPCEV